MTANELRDRINRVKQTLSTNQENDMAAPKKKAPTKKAPASNGDVGTPVEKVKKVKQADDPNIVTLAALCKELKITGQAARRKLRSAKLNRDGRWNWPKDSDELDEVREILTAKEEKEAA